MATHFEGPFEIDDSANLGQPRPDEEPEGPSNAERWQAMAQKGDVRGLLRETPNAFGGSISMNLLCRYVHDAIETLAMNDPAAFVQFVQADMLANIGKMVVRAHYLLDRAVRKEVGDVAIWTESEESRALADRVIALDAEAAKLLQTNVSTQLVMERARKLKLANDKAEARKHRPRQPRRQRVTRPQAAAAASRIGGDLP